CGRPRNTTTPSHLRKPLQRPVESADPIYPLESTGSFSQLIPGRRGIRAVVLMLLGTGVFPAPGVGDRVAMTAASGGAGPGGGPVRRWNVALSFAGAQRDYAGHVAAALKTRGGRCIQRERPEACAGQPTCAAGHLNRSGAGADR